MTWEQTSRDAVRDQQKSHRDQLLSLLRTTGDAMPCKDVAERLKWSMGRAVLLANVFPRYFCTWKDERRGLMMVDLHPHLRQTRTI